MMMRESNPIYDLWKHFPVNSELNKHIVSVHEEEYSFRCEICDYSFSLMSKMNKLVESVHEEEIHLDVRFVSSVFL